jgi:hypothetical protein
MQVTSQVDYFLRDPGVPHKRRHLGNLHAFSFPG